MSDPVSSERWYYTPKKQWGIMMHGFIVKAKLCSLNLGKLALFCAFIIILSSSPRRLSGHFIWMIVIFNTSIIPGTVKQKNRTLCFEKNFLRPPVCGLRGENCWFKKILYTISLSDAYFSGTADRQTQHQWSTNVWSCGLRIFFLRW